MRMSVRAIRVMAPPCAAAAIVLLATRAQSGTQPVLSSTDLVATWMSPAGGSITFANSNRFTAAGLRLDMFWGGCAGSGKTSVSGTWQFLSPQGDSGTGSYSKGNLVYLYFDDTAGDPLAGCTGGGITLTSWNTGSATALCLQFDPDTPCDGYVFERH
jgi:hypothetical protein